MKKFLSLIAAIFFAAGMMAETYTKTAYASLQTGDVVIITMQKDANVYAASNENGTSAAPTAVAVTVAEDAITTDATNILWTVVKDGDNISFQTGDNYLYCTNSNNGVRVGTNTNNVFSIDATSGYLYNNATSRYIGVYNGADWRCYTTVNSNITGQTLAFFAVAGGGVTPPVEQGCNWDEIAFLANGSGNAAYTDRFKVCAGDPAPTSIVNIQAPGWAAEAGIYVTFPSAAFGAISLENGQYAIDGAGMILYASAFLYEAEKEVTIVCQEVTYTLTIKNANPETAPVVPITCAAVYSLEKNAEVALNDVVVTYVNGRNVWVKDESAAMLLYLSADATWAAGDVLSGVAGVVDIYQNIVYEVKPSAAQAAAIVATPGETPAPSQHAVIEASDVNQYVILPGFSIEGAFTADSKTSLPAALGTDTVTIYNNFKFAYTFEAGKTYDIIGVVSAYKGNPQVYFISAEEATAPVEPLMKTIYCKMDKSWWTQDGAAVAVYTWDANTTPKAAWPGERMTPVEGEADLWSFELDINTYAMCIFTRVNGEGDVVDWGAKTTDLTIPTDENDMFTITNDDPTWGDPGCIGAWSKYEPAAPVEMTAIYDWAGEVGTTILGTSGVEISTVKIHTNKDEIPGIKFGSSYVYADGKWLAIKPAEGGFKAGDVVSVAAVFNNANTNNDKYAQIDLRAADGDTRIWLSDSASTINGRLVDDEPIVQTYTLEADQDSLLLGRYGNTALFITMLKVERAGGETPVVLEAPDAAPAAPTYPANQVHAMYSATYNADCIFGEWGSGTQVTQEEFGKKYVTTQLGYFGMEFPAGVDCSNMEALHLDVWAANDFSLRVVPIHGGAEVGKMVNIEGQKWNAIDIPLTEFVGVESWSNVIQIKIDEARGVTFWLNNVYFYTTQEQFTYTVAGSSAIAFGTTWDPANAENDMVRQADGTYKWEKTNLELAAGEIKFKVCENHAYTHSWPAQDYALAIPEGGLYTVTITFDPAAEADKVAAEAVKTGEAVVLPNVILHGNFSGNWADTDPFVAAADRLTAALTLTLAEGTYEFGFKFDGTWKANGANITRDANTTNLATGEGNMHITADVAGDYVLVYTFATQELVVTYPVNALTIPEDAPVPTVAEDDVMAIYCNHYANNNANFGISGWAGGYQTLVLNEINVGYWTGMTWECIIDPAHTDDAHDYSAYKNLHVDLWAPLPAKIKFVAEAVAGGNYKDGMVVEMQQGWNNVDFVVADWAGNYDFKNLKCFVFEQYQTLEGASFEGNPFAFANIYFYGKEGQGIDNTNVEMNAVKFIENGQLIILKNGVKYNVMGVIVR